MLFFLLLILVMPLANHAIWSRPLGELTLVKYLGGACLLYAIFHLAVRRRMPNYFAAWPARLFLLFYLITAVSYFGGGPRASTEFSPFLSYTSFLLLYFITVSIVDSLDRLRSVLLTAIGSVGLASLYVLREWQKYHGLYSGFRPGWVVGDSNYFALSALLLIFPAYFLLLEPQPRCQRVYCAGCLLVTLAAVTLCASRGGFLGLICALLPTVRRSEQRVKHLALAAVVLLPLTLLSPLSPLQRFLHPNFSDTLGTKNRLLAWSAGLRMIRAHPLAGVGLGRFKSVIDRYEDAGVGMESMAHNTYIEIAAELGLPALLVFVALLVCSYRSLEKVRREASRCDQNRVSRIAGGIQAGLFGYAVGAFFLPGEYQKLFWLILFLSACLPPILQGRDLSAVELVPAASPNDWQFISAANGSTASQPSPPPWFPGEGGFPRGDPGWLQEGDS